MVLGLSRAPVMPMVGEKYVTPATLAARVRAWKRALRGYRGAGPPRLELREEAAALLVIDLERYFTQPNSRGFLPAAEAILPRTLWVIEKFKKKGLPVIFTRHAHRKGDEGLMASWWGDVIYDSDPMSLLDPRLEPGGSRVIRKSRYSAFIGTGLEKALRSSQADTVCISGVLTHLCCESTARDAFMRDFQVIFLMDATATESEELHLSSLRSLADGFAEVTTCGELLKRLGWK